MWTDLKRLIQLNQAFALANQVRCHGQPAW
jgi:hypothetical protein